MSGIIVEVGRHSKSRSSICCWSRAWPV